MRKDRRPRTAQEMPEPDLGRCGVRKILATDDEIHVLAEVVHDHGEPVCPVALAVSNREIARDSHGTVLSAEEEVVPRLVAVTQGDAKGLRAVIRDVAIAAAAGTARS